MKIAYSKRGVVVRGRGMSRWWGAPYIMLGAIIVWYALTNDKLLLQEYMPFGVALGIAVMLAATPWLLPRDTIVFDLHAREIRETRYGVLGRRVRRLPFSRLASIGIETFQDPHSATVWSKRAVVRRTDGRRWHIDEATFPFAAKLDGGRGSADLVRIGRATGIEVLDETRLRRQPMDYVAA